MRTLGRIVGMLFLLLVGAAIIWIWFAFARSAVSSNAVMQDQLAATQGRLSTAAETRVKELVDQHELCDGALVQNLSDPNRNPVFDLPASYGAVISMDPGMVTVGGKVLISDGAQGTLVALYNATNAVTKVEVKTGWNSPNARWNIHTCVWQFSADQTFERASQWQGGSVAGEHKPVFRLYTLESTGPRDVTVKTPEVAKTPVPAGETTKIVCNSSGAWKGELKVPAGCVLWVSSDAGSGIVDGVLFNQTEGYTAKDLGPATVDLTKPGADKINHWMAPIGTMTADKDGKAINVKWDPTAKKFVNR